MIVSSPIRVTLPVLLVLLTLGVCSQVGAQTIPVPTADLLPTPDEVKNDSLFGHPCFPLSRDDGNWPAQSMHLLPPTTTVKYASATGDRTAVRRVSSDPLAWRVPYPTGANYACSQRVRELAIVELAAPPNNNQQLFAQVLTMVITRFADPAHATAALRERRDRDGRAGQLGDTINLLGVEGYQRKDGADRFADARDVYLVAQQGSFHIILAIDCPSPYYRPWLVQLVQSLAMRIADRVKPFSGGISTPTTPPVTPPVVTPPTIPPPTSPGYRVFIDGQLLRTQTPPMVISGRMLVGLADIFRALGAKVVWDGPTKKITATRASQTVELWIGRTTAFVDGAAVALDVPAMIRNSRTYVPIRFVSQALGAGVQYDGPNRAVLITTTSMPPIGGTPTNPPPQVTALTITSPADGSAVPAQFTIQGTGPPAKAVQIAATADATIKATGKNATSPMGNYVATVANNGRWSLGINASNIFSDQSITLTQMNITAMILVNGMPVEQVAIALRPGGQPGTGTPPAVGPLTVISPVDGATVPAQFSIGGAGTPGRTVYVTAMAEATLKATGQNATSPLLQDATDTVRTDHTWWVNVNASAVYNDQTVQLKQINITVETRANGAVLEKVTLVVRPPGLPTAGNRPPTAPTVTIGPARPAAGDDLYCKAEGSIDPDGDVVEYRVQWYNNGQLADGRIFAGLAAKWTKSGQTWMCVVTPTDGKLDGPSVQASVTIR